MTATIFKLRGLRADNLQAFLALLGILRIVDLRVVDLQCPQWRARARWRNEAAGGLAEIEIEAADAVSESDFVAEIAEGARKLLESLAKSIPKTGAPEDAETVVKMNHKNPQSAFVGVFAAPPPLPPLPPKNKRKKSPLFLLSRRQNCRKKATDLAKLQARDYEAALRDDWSYATSGNEGGMSWDPPDRREHARWRTNPSGDAFAVEKGGLALAICGWPSFMPAPIQGKEREIANAAPGWTATRKLRKGPAKSGMASRFKLAVVEEFRRLARNRGDARRSLLARGQNRSRRYGRARRLAGYARGSHARQRETRLEQVFRLGEIGLTNDARPKKRFSWLVFSRRR